MACSVYHCVVSAQINVFMQHENAWILPGSNLNKVPDWACRRYLVRMIHASSPGLTIFAARPKHPLPAPPPRRGS